MRYFSRGTGPQSFQCMKVFRSFNFFICRSYSNMIRPGFIKHPLEPITMKLDTPEFRGLFIPQLYKLSDLFKKYNYDLRIAGGAVRDLLLRIWPADVDFATTATPTQMKELFVKEQIRMLHKRGEEHGTITCRIDEKVNFEITTLRIDIVCDGRRAEVEYTKDWQLDANRRDFTINSLFLDLEGNVIDYFGGIEDIKQRRVAFVGNAAERIQEDYLRILRYFRFFGRLSKTNVHEEETLNAIIKHRDGLKGVSAERIWTELKKIVVGRMAPPVMECMLDTCKLGSYLGLPENYDLKRFSEVYDSFAKEVQPMTMISCLCHKPEEVELFHKKTKLSNAERDLAKFVITERNEAERNRDVEKWWLNKLVDLELKPEQRIINGRGCLLQLAMSICCNEETLKLIKESSLPNFPIKGGDLIEARVPKGPGFRTILLSLYETWKESDFRMGKEELLTHISPQCLENMKLWLLSLVAVVTAYSGEYDDHVTCRSVLKLMNSNEGSRLHSHDVKYGSGSGQQSVTAVKNSDDINSHWQIYPALNENCGRGDAVKCGSTIRLRHLSTGCWLHSHQFVAPLSKNNQEVSCFGGENDSDTGDHWQIQCDSEEWVQSENIRLKHVDTGSYLALSGQQYGRPISGQREVVATSGMSSGGYWKAAEGIFMAKNKDL